MGITWGKSLQETSERRPQFRNPGEREAISGADQLELPNVDSVRAEAAFAIGEIHLPHAPEAVVEAEPLERRPAREETAPPFPQRRSVAVSEHHGVLEAKFRPIKLGSKAFD